MLNILGGSRLDSHKEVIARALEIPGLRVHFYGKEESRPGRKMGHVTVTASTMREAEDRIEPLLTVVDKIRSETMALKKAGIESKSSLDVSKTTNPVRDSSGPDPLVAVTMGSHSDLPVLKPGLEILDQLEIGYTLHVTSAHRTPQAMMAFAESAAAKGLKVIIAAAGGAAHLPGMVASSTTLPVIGVPVKTSSLDGVDSLYSIVQMPVSLSVLHLPLSFYNWIETSA